MKTKCGHLILHVLLWQVSSLLANNTDESFTSCEKNHRDIVELKHELKQLSEDRVSVLEHQVSKLQQENSALKKQFLSQSGTGFTAVNYDRITYSNGAIIQFEVEVYDGNSNYDHTTGVYTCPANGMYLFSFEIFGASDINSSYCINIGSTEMSCSFSSGNRDGTASLVTHCNNGTQISVRASRAGTTPYGVSEGIPLSSFSGVLIAIDA